MPTQKQERLAQALIENAVAEEPLTMGELLENVGYAKSVSEAKPGEIIDQKGVKEALIEKGFSVEAADSVVQRILHNEDSQDKDRLKAADMIYDRLGAKAPEKSVTVNIDIKNYDPKLQELAEKYEAELREQFA